jgi:hypothetical protein
MFDKFNNETTTSYVIGLTMIYNYARKAASMHISYVSHVPLNVHTFKADFFPSTAQGASHNTPHLEPSEGFMLHILVFVQFVSCFHNYDYSIIWNNNQDTILSYLVSVKGRSLLKFVFFLFWICTTAWLWPHTSAETCCSKYYENVISIASCYWDAVIDINSKRPCHGSGG